MKIIKTKQYKQASRHTPSKCMDCSNKPEVECLWAEGMGHAWFCMKHFKEWATKGDGRGDVCSVKKVKDGKASDKFTDNKNRNIEKDFSYLKDK